MLGISKLLRNLQNSTPSSDTIAQNADAAVQGYDSACIKARAAFA
jgi:hypothetical protein